MLLLLGGVGHTLATPQAKRLLAQIEAAASSPVPAPSPVEAAASPSPTNRRSASPKASPVVKPPPPSPAPGVLPPGPIPPAGPPYPSPVRDVVVYDYADILQPATEASLTSTITAIEQRTGAEIVVYTQVKPESDTPAAAERDAIKLVDQWGIGRKGFDDGLAILFDMDQSKCHGQVQLYAGPGYRAAFLSNDERQAIYQNDMVPRLSSCDMDGAVLAAMGKIDANATPEHAAALTQSRQIDGAVGLIGAPLAFLLLSGWAAWAWFRYGRDPQYLDDPSVLMPAPPPDLTAASAAVIMDGRSTRHALTTAMLDLASRDELAFKDESGFVSKKVGIQMLAPRVDDPMVARNRRRPLSDAEDFVLTRLQSIADHSDRYITPTELLQLGASVDKFDRALERHVVGKGWFRELPAAATHRWSVRGSLELVLGIVLAFIALNLPSGGLLLSGVALAAAGIVTLVISRAMPARTVAGAMIQAMLLAYRRTLQKTMAQARSMQQVVESRLLPWLETPDQAVVWGVALGLRGDVEQVLARSVEDARAGKAASSQAWLPAWYLSGAAGGGGGAGGGSGFGAAPGLFSASAIPNFDSMFAAVGSIGDSPSSSGSGGGGSGGFGGGGSGGGGGGAGGGF